MTSYTVADRAKARKVNEKTLLKNRGQRVVEVGGLCESPQLFNDLGSLRSEPEEIWNNSKSFLDALS